MPIFWPLQCCFRFVYKMHWSSSSSWWCLLGLELLRRCLMVQLDTRWSHIQVNQYNNSKEEEWEWHQDGRWWRQMVSTTPTTSSSSRISWHVCLLRGCRWSLTDISRGWLLAHSHIPVLIRTVLDDCLSTRWRHTLTRSWWITQRLNSPKDLWWTSPVIYYPRQIRCWPRVCCRRPTAHPLHVRCRPSVPSSPLLVLALPTTLLCHRRIVICQPITKTKYCHIPVTSALFRGWVTSPPHSRTCFVRMRCLLASCRSVRTLRRRRRRIQRSLAKRSWQTRSSSSSLARIPICIFWTENDCDADGIVVFQLLNNCVHWVKFLSAVPF